MTAPSRRTVAVLVTAAIFAGALGTGALAAPIARAAGPGPAATPFATVAGATAVDRVPRTIAAPSRAHGATLAGIVRAAMARSRPGGGRRVWRVRTSTIWSAEPQVLLVLGSAMRRGRQWLRVLLPIRPNHSTGWIPRDNAILLRTRYWVTVDKRARSVVVSRGGRRVRRYRAVIGKRDTPTPHGLAAIYERDRQPDPDAFLGPWALPLTAFSDVLLDFGGGPGRIAIHGRAGASLDDPLGHALSHGCIRIDNGPIAWMARHLPKGTPVRITG